MALIVDPDFLVDGQEIVIDTTGRTVQLVVTGSLSTDGATIKAAYSKLKELWKTNDTYIRFPFPMTPITDEQFEMTNQWDWKDNTTRYLLRTGGWAVVGVSGSNVQEWTGVISLGSIAGADQAYFLQSGSLSIENFQLTGPVNQAVQVYSASVTGVPVFDYRSFLTTYVRIEAKTYSQSALSDIGVTGNVSYQAYRFPLSNTADAKITHSDSFVDGNTPYTGMSITWYTGSVSRTIGGVPYGFHVIIDGNSGTAEEVYEFVQRQLRKATDIDAGPDFVKTGNKTDLLLRFVGDTLYTIYQTQLPSGGVYIDNQLAADVNRLIFLDDTNTERQEPFTSVMTINFGDNLKNDASAKYWVYYTSVPSGSYGTADAVLVNDFTGLPMTGSVGGASSVQRTFDYDFNTQGGRTAATDAAITAVAIGLTTSQFVRATSLITRSVAGSISLVSALERNYSNPV